MNDIWHSKIRYAQLAAYIIEKSRFKTDIENIVIEHPYEVFILFSFIFSVFSDELEPILDEYYLKSNQVIGFMSCVDLAKACWNMEDEFALIIQEYDITITTSVLRRMCVVKKGLIYNNLPRSLLISLLNDELSNELFFDKIFEKQLEGLDMPKTPMISF